MAIGDLIFCVLWGTILTMWVRNILFDVYRKRITRLLDARCACQPPEDTLRLFKYVASEFEKIRFTDLLFPWRPIAVIGIYRNIKNGNY